MMHGQINIKQCMLFT